MNIKYNKSFRSILQSIANFFSDLAWTVFSIMLILLMSSFRVARKNRKERVPSGSKCCVLGNGPSLKDALDNNEVNYDGCDVVCVNMFCRSEYFKILKPRYYYIVDRVYFMPITPRHNQLINDLLDSLNSADWDIELIIPKGMPGGRLVNELKNPHVKVSHINLVWIKGFEKFCHFCYNRQYAIPRCENILGVVLTLSVMRGYETVYVYGADHTWLKDLYVDDDNVVCYGDRHVYHKDLQVIKKEYPLHILLSSFATVFKAHQLVNDYAKKQRCKIINCTKGSFIDAYVRLKTMSNQ